MNGDSSNGYLPFPRGFSTRAIHAGQDPEQWDSMCVIPPIVMSTTFKQYGPAKFKVSKALLLKRRYNRFDFDLHYLKIFSTFHLFNNFRNTNTADLEILRGKF